ncbi:MAG: NUDIX hydrolase [Actinomycetota bacterium]|jgi:8-oxo-dGTP diphosphatase
MNPGRTVRAAGGVVWRRGPGGGVEVLLVHRPRYDDWTLPKGKLAAGEDDRAGALREVWEETGLHCELGTELATSHYVDAQGRPKTVRYWAMRPGEGQFHANAEVDRLRWISLPAARAALTYDRDREVIDSLYEAVPE